MFFISLASIFVPVVSFYLWLHKLKFGFVAPVNASVDASLVPIFLPFFYVTDGRPYSMYHSVHFPARRICKFY